MWMRVCKYELCVHTLTSKNKRDFVCSHLHTYTKHTYTHTWMYEEMLSSLFRLLIV
jgi:hypothetical protein